MLCQLVCVDRRYQRMNCFNIRELQGNLKRKFFGRLNTLLSRIEDHASYDFTWHGRAMQMLKVLRIQFTRIRLRIEKGTLAPGFL